jgi:hypothetical protein
MTSQLTPTARRTLDPRDPGIAGAPDAPLRLPLGNDALAVLRQGYKSNAEELERWVHLARSTDFDGLAVSDVDHAVLKLNSA